MLVIVRRSLSIPPPARILDIEANDISVRSHRPLSPFQSYRCALSAELMRDDNIISNSRPGADLGRSLDLAARFNHSASDPGRK
jgi:hypothetical protein